VPIEDIALYSITSSALPSFEPASRLEHVGDEHCQQMEDRKHHVK
jgi:hypothetical protein